MPDDDTAPSQETAVPDAAATSEAAPDAAPDEGAPDAAPDEGAGQTRLQRLEAEGDAAADFLEELLDIVDLDGDIDLDVEGDRATVSVVGEDLSWLVGENGKVLDAVQELTRLAVLQETGERSRLMLDVGGHRARRRAELERLAGEVVEAVRKDGEAQRMDPMHPFERKVVHDTVAAAGLVSESEGEEPDRRVVVLPTR